MPFMPAFPDEKHRHRRFIVARRGNCFGAGRLRRLRWRLEVASTAAASNVGRAPELETEDNEERSKEALRIRRLRPSSQICGPLNLVAFLGQLLSQARRKRGNRQGRIALAGCGKNSGAGNIEVPAVES